MLPEELVSLVEMTAVEWRERRVEAAVEDADMTQVLREKHVVVPPQGERAIEDDWFVQLDIPTRKSSFAPPGIDTQSL